MSSIGIAIAPLLGDLVSSIVRGAGHDLGRKGIDLSIAAIGGARNAPVQVQKRHTQGSKRSYAKNKGPRAYIPVRIRGQ